VRLRCDDEAIEAVPEVGRLEAYVCADCGYHETYVKEPDAVPWDRIAGFAWVNPPPADTGPFR